MPTEVTSVFGGTAKPGEMVYVPLERARIDEDFKDIGDGLNGPFLADLLSAILTHERCGTHLYRSVAGRTQNPVLKRKYEHFGEETARHVEILERLIAGMGGDPMYVSPAARATEKADAGMLESTFLLSGSGTLLDLEMSMLDAVFLAEAKDHDNWQCLKQLVPSLPAGKVRDDFAHAVAEVEEQEDEHFGWARDMRTKMISLQLRSSAMTAVAGKAEEMLARIKGLFADDRT